MHHSSDKSFEVSSSSGDGDSKDRNSRSGGCTVFILRYWYSRPPSERIFSVLVGFLLMIICYIAFYTIHYQSTHSASSLISNNDISLSSSKRSKLIALSSSESLPSSSLLSDNSTNKQLIDLSPPLSRQTLGHAVWSFLHQTAAQYPLTPTKQEQNAIIDIIHALPVIYPCRACAKHFLSMIEKDPPESHVDSRDALSNYFCILHNNVNRRLDKPIISCDKIAEYWPDKLGNSCGCADVEEEEKKSKTR